MAKKKSKSAIIAAYVAKHPEATWRTAAPDLEKHGISGGYFASQRSKLKNESSTSEVADSSASVSADLSAETKPRSKAGRKSGRKGTTKQSGGAVGLVDAVEFARKAGGVQQARALLEELARVQV